MEDGTRQEFLRNRQKENQETAERVELSRQKTLAKRVEQRRRNAEVYDIRSTGRGCTAATVRCPEARVMLLDTPECCKAHIRHILSDLAELMDRDGIRWWIDYGTLLGWVRNGGLIRYDKDADLGVYGPDREKLLALRPELLAMGYHPTYATPRPTQRFRTGDRLKVRLSNKNSTNVDVFIWEDRPGKILDRKNYIGADMYKGREFPKSWAFPLGRGEWDGINVSVPAEPKLLAEHRYGASWQEERREKHPLEVRK